jgi:hypothetical protein
LGIMFNPLHGNSTETISTISPSGRRDRRFRRRVRRVRVTLRVTCSHFFNRHPLKKLKLLIFFLFVILKLK